jgi:hypothetical protein
MLVRAVTAQAPPVDATAAAYRVVELVRDLRPAQILEATEPTVLVSLREWEALRKAAAEVPPRGRRCTGG